VVVHVVEKKTSYPGRVGKKKVFLKKSLGKRFGIGAAKREENLFSNRRSLKKVEPERGRSNLRRRTPSVRPLESEKKKSHLAGRAGLALRNTSHRGFCSGGGEKIQRDGFVALQNKKTMEREERGCIQRSRCEKPQS